LLEKPDNETREYAADSLLELYGAKAAVYLEKMEDAPIQQSLTDWRIRKNGGG